jgi:hypothetical protein
MMTEFENEVADFIIEKLTFARRLTGASLGKTIRDKFSQLDLKTTYGGLSQFINIYCGDKVVQLGHQGGDIMFALKDTDGEGQSGSPFIPSTPKELWLAFTNPSAASDIVVDSDTGQLHVDAGDEVLPNNHFRIQPITKEDYRIIAREFLNDIEKPLQDELQEAVQEDDFWPKFSTILRQHKDEGILDHWLKWREQQILGLFKSRLDQVGLPEDIQLRAIGYLKYSREQKLPTMPKPSLIKTNPSQSMQWSLNPKRLAQATQDNRYKTSDTRSTIDLRSILHDAIDTIEEVELRRIWLPVGVVLDAIKKSGS